MKSRHPEAEIHILVGRRSSFAEPSLKGGFFHLHVIPLSPTPSFFSLKMLRFLLECGVGGCRTFFLFLKLRPKLVIGFGSLSSVPGVLFAAMFRIPILIHEQNAVSGRANQFLARWANRIAISFPETQGKFNPEKIVWAGYPLRPAFWEVVRKPDREEARQKPFTVLVLGGSQGAKHLNVAFLKALETLRAEERKNLAVIHNVGGDNLNEIRTTYQSLGIAAEVDAFSYEIAHQYRRADLVISRAGAGTIFELAAMGRAAILIPYPHAYAHQKVNAERLMQKASARVIDDEDLEPSRLRDLILELKNNPDERIRLGMTIRKFAKDDASQTLVDIGWKLICDRN